MSGRSRATLLSYETIHRVLPRNERFGILLFGRSRVPPWFYLFSTAMVALGTTFSAFWIMVNNSWMQVPIGYTVERRPDSHRLTGRRFFSAPSSGCAFRTCFSRRI